MKDNFQYFIKEFKPSHKKYNSKNKYLSMITKSDG